MKRESFLDVEYFFQAIEKRNRMIADNENFIRDNSSTDKRWDIVYLFLFQAQLQKAICMFSIGEPIEKIASLTKEAINNYIIYVNDANREKLGLKDIFGNFHDALIFSSFAVLFRLEEKDVKALSEAVEEMGGDLICSRLLQTISPGTKLSKKLAWPKIMANFYAVFDAPILERPNIIKAYLSGWYQTMKKSEWYGTHKSKKGLVFIGYWSLEAAAVTVALDIDDSSYRDMPYYPKDLVDYCRENKK